MSEPPTTSRARSVMWVGLFAAALAVARPAALLIVPPPIAVCLYRGRGPEAAGYIVVALVLGLVFGDAPFGMFVAVGLGAFVGWGLRRNLSFTAIVLTGAGLVFVMNAGMFALGWEDLEGQIQSALATANEKIEEGGAGLTENQLAQLKLQRWILAHWAYVFFGMTFAASVMAVCAVTAGTSAWLRARHQALVATRFTQFRPPEWAVWLVIVVAVLWFVDQQWPSDAVRGVAWNGAFALAGVYWLAGLAVVLHGVMLWRPNALLLAVLSFAAVLTGMLPVLVIVGLFDTWLEFRVKMDARASGEPKEDNRGDV